MQRLTKLVTKLVTKLGAILVLALAGCSSKDTSKPQSELSQPSPATAEPTETMPDAAALLDAHTQAAGGADKIPNFETIHAKGTMDTGSQKLSGTVELWWKKGGNFYLEQYIDGVGLSRVGYDGKTIWIDDPVMQLRVIDGEEAQSYLQTSLIFLSHDWREHFSDAKTLGKQPVEGGGEAWEVELVSKGGPNLIVGLDVGTKLMRYQKTVQVTPLGRMPIEAYADDYREVDGYKFSMKRLSKVKPLFELQEDITVFEVNVPIDESKFAYPSKREQVPADPAAQPPVVVPPTEPPPAEPDKG